MMFEIPDENYVQKKRSGPLEYKNYGVFILDKTILLGPCCTPPELIESTIKDQFHT